MFKKMFLSIMIALCVLPMLASAYTPQQLQQLKAEASAGDVTAQFNLGVYYFDKRDYKEALKWYERAAKQNDPGALNNLSVYYTHGLGGVEVDYSKAIELTKKSMQLGNRVAVNNMGYMYQEGYGVEKNLSTALSYYLRSAQEGYVVAKYNVGNTYLELNNPKLAYHWLKIAAEDGSIDAAQKLAFMVEFGVGIEQSYPQAYKLFKVCAEKGSNVCKKGLQQLLPKMSKSQIDQGKQLYQQYKQNNQ